MPKITLHEGETFDPYAYPEVQATTGPQIVETDIKEVADADKDVEYKKEDDSDKKEEDSKKEEGDDLSVGNSFLTSTKPTPESKKKNVSKF